jgi:hypothetical protein
LLCGLWHQLLALLDRETFGRRILRGEDVQSSPKPVVGFKCWQHAPCLVYGQKNWTSRAAVVAARKALRRVEMCILIY